MYFFYSSVKKFKVIKIKTYHQVFYTVAIRMRFKQSRDFNINTVCDHPIVLTVSEYFCIFLQTSVRMKRYKHTCHKVFLATEMIGSCDRKPFNLKMLNRRKRYLTENYPILDIEL